MLRKSVLDQHALQVTWSGLCCHFSLLQFLTGSKHSEDKIGTLSSARTLLSFWGSPKLPTFWTVKCEKFLPMCSPGCQLSRSLGSSLVFQSHPMLFGRGQIFQLHSCLVCSIVCEVGNGLEGIPLYSPGSLLVSPSWKPMPWEFSQLCFIASVLGAVSLTLREDL